MLAELLASFANRSAGKVLVLAIALPWVQSCSDHAAPGNDSGVSGQGGVEPASNEGGADQGRGPTNATDAGRAGEGGGGETGNGSPGTDAAAGGSGGPSGPTVTRNGDTAGAPAVVACPGPERELPEEGVCGEGAESMLMGSCEYGLPEPPSEFDVVDPRRGSVYYVLPTGDERAVPLLEDESQCAGSTTGGWYWDRAEERPTSYQLCPCSCDAAAEAQVIFVLGCSTQMPEIQSD